MKLPAVCAALALLAACASPPAKPSPALAVSAERAVAPATLKRRFSAEVSKRYAPGSPLAAASRDLVRSGFQCRPPRGTLGDPPDRACRRTLSKADCAYTWQVFLYDDPLTRVRALFDRVCGPDPLLGGPA